MEVVTKLRQLVVDAVTEAGQRVSPANERVIADTLHRRALATLATLETCDPEFDALTLVREVTALLSADADAPATGAAVTPPSLPSSAASAEKALQQTLQRPEDVAAAAAAAASSPALSSWLAQVDVAVQRYCKLYGEHYRLTALPADRRPASSLPHRVVTARGSGGDVSRPMSSSRGGDVLYSARTVDDDALSVGSDGVLSLCAPSYDEIGHIAANLSADHPAEVRHGAVQSGALEEARVCVSTVL